MKLKHMWWLTPEFSQHRCSGPAKDRADHRCHNLATSEGLCRVHLRLAGRPITCQCRCGCAGCVHAHKPLDSGDGK